MVSKNTREDVEALFAARTDFPLRLSDFSAVEIGWGSKSDAIKRACVQLRIDPSAIVFIDDNPGELLEVLARLDRVVEPSLAGRLQPNDHAPIEQRWAV